MPPQAPDRAAGAAESLFPKASFALPSGLVAELDTAADVQQRGSAVDVVAKCLQE